MSEPYLSLRQAAESIGGIPPRTLRRWAASGFFPVVRINSRFTLCKLSDIRTFIESRTTPRNSGVEPQS